MFAKKLLKPFAIASSSLSVLLSTRNERGKFDLLFSLPIACLRIFHNCLVLCLFSSIDVLKYVILALRFNLLRILRYVLYAFILVSVGFFSFFVYNFDLFLDDVIRPNVIHGDRLIAFSPTFNLRSGNDLLKHCMYRS